MGGYKELIKEVPNFPIKGVNFKDISPLLGNRKVFNKALDDMFCLVEDVPDYWVGIESRGFLFASALSFQFGGGIKLIRKKGKLPKIATINHANVENKKVCLRLSLNSFSKLARMNKIPIKIVINADEIKL